MDLERRHGYGNNGFIYYGQTGVEERECGNGPTMESLKVFPISSSSSSSLSPHQYIEHYVTKFDTLAGIAIKYGVEVTDIKKINGLVSDLQMFARKMLLIPLPGRHPPSSHLSNDLNINRGNNYKQTPPRRVRSALLDSFQSLGTLHERKISPAMSDLRGYYGLNSHEKACHQDEASIRPLCRRSKSMANFSKVEDDELANCTVKDIDKWVDKHIWRCQKSELDIPCTPKKLLKEDNGSGGWFSAVAGKGLALRKVPSRNNLAAEGEGSGTNGVISILADSCVPVSSLGVKKSFSTPSLQDQETNYSIFSALNWSLRPDLHSTLSKPIIDGLTMSIVGLRVKTALD